MADTANYTHFDIGRYLNHKMTKQEMHDFEKAMMEDPFLADAFEGYSKSDIDVATVHLAQIEKQLTVKKEKAKVVPMLSRKYAWWKVAALIILIAGVGTIGYRVFDKPAEQAQIVANKPTSDKSVVAPVTEGDTIRAEQKTFTASPVFPAPSKELLAAKKNSAPVTIEQNTNSIAAMKAPMQTYDSSMVATNAQPSLKLSELESKTDDLSSPPTAKSATPEVRLSGRVVGVQANSALREFKGRVVDPTGEPLAFATIHGNKDVGTVADANGKFYLKAPDSVLDVSVVVVGYGTTRARLQSNVLNNKILVKEKNETSLAEVVVTSIGRKKRDSTSFLTQNVASNEGSGIEPVKGWKQFQQYIFENLQQIKDTSVEYESGDVVLEFDVDTKGRPSKIKALESGNEQNAVKAIELLQNGPKWKRKKNSKGKVVVIF